MDNHHLQEPAPRVLEIFVGVVLLVMSALFISVVIYFAYLVAFRNGVLNWITISIDLVIGMIGFFLGRWGVRLLRSDGVKGNIQLMSSSTIYIWSSFFGIAGLIFCYFGIVEESLSISGTGIWSVLFGVTGYKYFKNVKDSK